MALAIRYKNVWNMALQAHIPKPYAVHITSGKVVKYYHICPRCKEIGAGPMTAITLEDGTILMSEELSGYRDRDVLRECVSSIFESTKLPCINHDGVT